MKHTLIVLSILFFAFNKISAQTNTDTIRPLSIGDTRVLKSVILGENRILNICLPYNYDKQIAYPVIYLLDGSVNEDIIHITGLVQFFNLMFQMPDFIVVGIANVERKRDFTFPTKLKDLKEKYPTTGGSAKFIDFIEKELQPFIQFNYKTTETKYIIGQSLGGLLASEILLKKPFLFTHYFIISPSLWWNNESLLDEAKEILSRQSDNNLYVYISVGAEGKLMEYGAEKLAKALNKSKKKNLTVDFLPLPKENHATILHNSMYEAFKIQFPYKEQ